jgi:hypothetical protein
VPYPPALPGPEAIRDEERSAYEQLLEQQLAYAGMLPHGEDVFSAESVTPLAAALLNSPLVAAALFTYLGALNGRVDYPEGMSGRDREWIVLVVNRELRTFNSVYLHARFALQAGVRFGAIVALVQGRDDELTVEERTKAEFARAIMHGTSTQAKWEGVQELIGVRATVELTCWTASILLSSRLSSAFGVQDVSEERLKEFISGLAEDQPVGD